MGSFAVMDEELPANTDCRLSTTEITQGSNIVVQSCTFLRLAKDTGSLYDYKARRRCLKVRRL